MRFNFFSSSFAVFFYVILFWFRFVHQLFVSFSIQVCRTLLHLTKLTKERKKRTQKKKLQLYETNSGIIHTWIITPTPSMLLKHQSIKYCRYWSKSLIQSIFIKYTYSARNRDSGDFFFIAMWRRFTSIWNSDPIHQMQILGLPSYKLLSYFTRKTYWMLLTNLHLFGTWHRRHVVKAQKVLVSTIIKIFSSWNMLAHFGLQKLEKLLKTVEIWQSEGVDILISVTVWCIYKSWKSSYLKQAYKRNLVGSWLWRCCCCCYYYN